MPMNPDISKENIVIHFVRTDIACRQRDLNVRRILVQEPVVVPSAIVPFLGSLVQRILEMSQCQMRVTQSDPFVKY